REQQAKRLSFDDYKKLLAEWRDEIARSVLANNQRQTQFLAIANHHALLRHREYAVLADFLEHHAKLDRQLEALPDVRTWESRGRIQQPLTRAELAILLSYTKNWLKSALATAELFDDKQLLAEAQGVFPLAIRKNYASTLLKHPLAVSLAATRLASLMTERLGMGALPRLLTQEGSSALKLARAFMVARVLLGLDELWYQLDNCQHLPDDVLLPQYAALQRYARRATGWLLSYSNKPSQEIIASFNILLPLLNDLPHHLSHKRLESWQNAKNNLVAKGLPDALAVRLASLDQILPLLDMCRLSLDLQVSVENVAYVYEIVEDTLSLMEVQRALQDLTVANPWEAAARDQLRTGLLKDMATLTQDVLEQWKASQTPLHTWLALWLHQHQQAFSDWRQFRCRLSPSDLTNYAPYVVLTSQLHRLLEQLAHQDGVVV
ncbi:MAG: NAD-glutamate dehydrogenase, partial [Pseudomonadales bacterium]|nr:NAD-glutamate dehydrogenase [Pseudomonadales bacterium]